MKIKPELFLGSKKDISYKNILITGLDESYISYVKDFVVNNFKKRNFYIDVSGNHNKGLLGNLFSDKKTLFLINDCSIMKNIDSNNDHDQHLLIVATNNKKSNIIKSSFAKSKNSLVLECYLLSRNNKEVVLKSFVEESGLSLSNDVFWYIIDNFDNNYVVFINQLKTVSLFNKTVKLISDVEKITYVENKIELNKIFFYIVNNNTLLTRVFLKNVNSVSDFYIFLNSIKLYVEIIKESSNKESALAKFPRYLFAEREIFLKIYNNLNKKKIITIYSQLAKAELLIRKHADLYSVVGLRFLLNLKKIVIS